MIVLAPTPHFLLTHPRCMSSGDHCWPIRQDGRLYVNFFGIVAELPNCNICRFETALALDASPVPSHPYQ